MSLIKSFVDKCLADGSKKIYVAGDSMIDEYYQVLVNRLSPEFPIPILAMKEERMSVPALPGGAANTCYQLTKLPCQNGLISFLNTDALHIFRDSGIYCKSSLIWDSFQIPRKKRYYDGDNPICRMDVEKENYGVEDINKYRFQIREQVNTRLCTHDQEKPDVLILSDYGKGFFGDSPDWTRNNLVTIVDPKDGPLDKWHGCKIFKPNSGDAKKLSKNMYCKDSQCLYMSNQLGCENIVVTDGGNGIYGRYNGQFFKFDNQHKVIPRSVVGAGDAFSAFLALAIAHGFTVQESSNIAFEAGQCYIKSIHNEPVTLYDLLNSEDPIGAKYLPTTGNGCERLVFVNGCFDVLHSGHIAFLRFAASKGNRLIVALNSDASISRLKGNGRPIRSLKDRMEAVACLEFVDHVTSFEEDTPDKCMINIMPNVIIKGGEYNIRSLSEIACAGEEIYFFPRIQGFSTTEEIERIRS